MVPYRPAEAQTILTRLSQAEGVSGRFDRAVVAAFAGRGVRRGELLRLRHGDVDLDGGVVIVTRLLRRFELTSEDEVLLERYLGSAAAVDGYAATTVVGRRSALRSWTWGVAVRGCSARIIRTGGGTRSRPSCSPPGWTSTPPSGCSGM